MVFSILAFSVIAIALFFAYNKLKQKPTKVIKPGDYVLLRHSYYREYPFIPKNLALTVDKVEGDSVVVHYMLPKEILKASLKKEALQLTS